MIKLLKTALLTIVGVIIGVVLAIIILVAGAASLVAPSLSGETISVSKGSTLEINMDEIIVESPRPQTIDRMLGMSINTRETTLFDMIRAIEFAAVDPKIEAIELRLDGTQAMSLAVASELRLALKKFQNEGGKPIFAYAEEYSQTEYFVASIADEITIHPLGSIEWRGIAMTSLYYGDLLKGLNIEVEVFRPEECIYKSAVEPFTRSSMSEESRAQSQTIVDGMWNRIIKAVAHERGIEERALREVAENEVILDAQQAIKHKFVTGADSDYQPSEKRITLSKYAAFAKSMIEQNSDPNSKNQIAIIYADGVIGVEKDDYRGINAERFTKLLRKAADDKNIKGVVIRVNSPGGGAMAADVIATEVKKLHREKMVIISMGSMAASGGYYMSAPADMIFANTFTITGSIGVYGMMLNLEEAAKIGLNIVSDGVGSAPSADFGSSFRGVNTTERRAIMRGVDNIYTAFKQVVAEGRDMPMAKVDTISQGRIWSGEEAARIRLADHTGGLNTAVSYAFETLNNGETMDIVEILDEPEGWEYLFSSFGNQISALISSAIGLQQFDTPMRERARLQNDMRQIIEMEGGVISYTPLQLRP